MATGNQNYWEQLGEYHNKQVFVTLKGLPVANPYSSSSLLNSTKSTGEYNNVQSAIYILYCFNDFSIHSFHPLCV